jgi:acetyl esterase/lipase
LSGAVVVSPDYTLSIKKPYPAALHDAYSALLWLKENAGRLGADETMLMVGGQSAGGGLAAALALYARDKGEVKIVLQMPIYPMIDDRTISGKDANNLLWSRKNNAEAWRLYLGEFYGAPDVPFYAAPARAQDLSNMPPAIGFIGSLDLFLDETKAYFAGLKDAGVEAQLRIYGGCYHGFEAVHPKAEVSKKAVSEFISAFMDFIESGAR